MCATSCASSTRATARRWPPDQRHVRERRVVARPTECRARAALPGDRTAAPRPFTGQGRCRCCGARSPVSSQRHGRVSAPPRVRRRDRPRCPQLVETFRSPSCRCAGLRSRMQPRPDGLPRGRGSIARDPACPRPMTVDRRRDLDQHARAGRSVDHRGFLLTHPGPVEGEGQAEGTRHLGLEAFGGKPVRIPAACGRRDLGAMVLEMLDGLLHGFDASGARRARRSDGRLRRAGARCRMLRRARRRSSGVPQAWASASAMPKSSQPAKTSALRHGTVRT